MDAKQLRIGIYARISEDRNGQQTATARQLEDCRAFAERKGWEVADEFEDIDTSAFKTNVKRPEFARMLGALRSGEIDGAVVWKLDRLSRQQRDLVRVMEACDVHKAFIASVMEPIDTGQSYGQFIAELLVAQARMESANASARQTRKAQERREQGKPPSNGGRCFGYTRGYSGLVPEEAALLREARDRLFAGESMRGVCFDFQARGVVSTAGNPWRRQILKRCLISATLSGQREHEGRLFPGSWEPIFSPADTERLRRMFATNPGVGRPRAATGSLLVGFVRCGICGQRMSTSTTAQHRRRYACSKRPGNTNCGGVTTLADPLDELVAEIVFAAVDDVALADALRARGGVDDGLLSCVQRDEAALEELTNDFYTEQLVSREDFFVTRSALTARLEANREKLSRRDRRGVLGQFVGDGNTLRQAWEAGSLEWRRAIMAALLERVEIAPATEKGRKPFDANRVRPVWRY